MSLASVVGSACSQLTVGAGAGVGNTCTLTRLQPTGIGQRVLAARKAALLARTVESMSEWHRRVDAAAAWLLKEIERGLLAVARAVDCTTPVPAAFSDDDDAERVAAVTPAACLDVGVMVVAKPGHERLVRSAVDEIAGQGCHGLEFTFFGTHIYVRPVH